MAGVRLCCNCLSWLLLARPGVRPVVGYVFEQLGWLWVPTLQCNDI